MTQEQKQILLADLCARLPYGVKVCNITKGRENIKGTLLTISKYVPYSVHILTDHASGNQEYSPIEDIRPYLRPMDSMTEDEKKEYRSLLTIYNCGGQTTYWDNYKSIDWLIKHHFDFRHFIPMGLALEAKEGMYNIK